MLTHLENLGYLTDYALRFFPDKVALVDPAQDIQLTYASLDERANQVANGLRELGVERGTRVALLFGNEFQYVEALLGTIRSGGVAVPVNVRLGPEGLQHVVVDSGATVLLASANQAAVAAELASTSRQVRHLVVVRGRPEDAIDYESWLRSADTEQPEGPMASGSDLCMQPYTSGSTGRPKGVLLDHVGQIHNAETMRRVLMISPDQRALVVVPLFHANAMSAALLPFLMAAGSVVILPEFDATEAIRSIERYGCTYMTGVPAMYQMMLGQSDELAAQDVSSIELLVCGSAPVPERLLSQLQDAFGGVDVVEGYGLTEGGPVVLLTPRWGIKKLGSVGLPLPGTEVKIVSGDGGRMVAHGEVGELCVRSPGTAQGYHDLPEVTAARFTTDGWLKTGDLMRADEDGYHYFVGRVDDMINVGGENVYPKEVESILGEHPHVDDVCVVGVHHDIKGQVPVAFVVGDAPQLSETAVKDYFIERGPAFAHPRRVFVVDALPLSGAGKVDRAELQRRAEALASPVPAASQRP